MGSVLAAELASGELNVTMEQAIGWHLQGNHYPPIPSSMIQPCIDAIDAGNEEDWGRLIALPEGVFYKGETEAPAWAMIEQHHLSAWIHSDEDEFY